MNSADISIFILGRLWELKKDLNEYDFKSRAEELLYFYAANRDTQPVPPKEEKECGCGWLEPHHCGETWEDKNNSLLSMTCNCKGNCKPSTPEEKKDCLCYRATDYHKPCDCICHNSKENHNCCEYMNQPRESHMMRCTTCGEMIGHSKPSAPTDEIEKKISYLLDGALCWTKRGMEAELRELVALARKTK